MTNCPKCGISTTNLRTHNESWHRKRIVWYQGAKVDRDQNSENSSRGVAVTDTLRPQTAAAAVPDLPEPPIATDHPHGFGRMFGALQQAPYYRTYWFGNQASLQALDEFLNFEPALLSHRAAAGRSRYVLSAAAQSCIGRFHARGKRLWNER